MMHYRLLLATTICALLIHAHSSHHGTPPFYRITKPGSADTSYVFGTLHLLEGGFVDTMKTVMSALRSSDEVVGELVLDSSSTSDAMQAIFSGPRLDSLLTEEQYHAVSKVVKSYVHLPLMVLDHTEPVVIYTMILAGMYQKEHPENHKTGVPMDLFFEQEAQRLGKKVIGLESAEGQEQLLDSIPMDEQIADLMELVSNPKKAMKDMNTMLADYRTGNIERILDDPSFGSLSSNERGALIDDRNKNWTDTLPTLMTGHRLFIAVGAGHLPGKNGLLEGLKKEGFQVTPVPPN